jgi:aspartate/glutamate racemase
MHTYPLAAYMHAVVLGCTEIPLLVTEAESPLPAIDSTRTLARAALREATRDVCVKPNRIR